MSKIHSKSAQIVKIRAPYRVPSVTVVLHHTETRNSSFNGNDGVGSMTDVS